MHGLSTILSLSHWRKLFLGFVHFVCSFRGSFFRVRRMSHSAAFPDHEIFAKTSLYEVRPGRKINLLHIDAPQTADTKEPWTVFFIHGSMGNMQQFEGQIVEYSKTCRVIAFDAFGCGQSQKPRDYHAYSHDNFFTDLESIFEKFKGKKNLLISHSFGTSMAIQLAGKKANEKNSNIAGIVLIGGGFAPSHFPSKSLKLFKIPLIFLEVMHPLLSKGFVARALHAETIEQKTKDHKRLVQRVIASQGKNPMHVCQAFYQQARWANVEDIAMVKCSVLVLVGEGDKLTPPAYSKALCEELKKNSSLFVQSAVIPHTSHQVMQEQPVEVCELISEFMRRMDEDLVDKETVKC
uniref:Serine aminopeptidase S33 domain-containing protein n=1 Tax=Hanusia phi TaxID=3032 RepID=A0A7S0HB03_9CRYP|mmetsp:Transcript_11026/g.25015  ORF Transcript_11026/g.25015 Transcript_11026/m.25015 type:complete len:350 (+) Transcript_11026:71-1120(+)